MRGLALLAAGLLLSGCEWWFGEGEQCERLGGDVDGSLVLADSCYVVDDTLTVRGDVVATEGTQVAFAPGAGVVVHGGGRFDAQGTSERPVVLRGDEGFSGVVFGPGSSGTLRGTEIYGGGFVEEGSCTEPSACVVIAPGAEVMLDGVGLEACAGPGVAGEAAEAGDKGVGCTGQGVCLEAGCTEPWEWCGEDGCAGEAWEDSLGEDECAVGERRCRGGRYVDACLGGRWETLTDCSAGVVGQTACRDGDGFPRCGRIAPRECLSLPEVPGGSFVPACGEEGCPAYASACEAAGQLKSCQRGAADDVALTGCVHPEVSAAVLYSGLGPRWMRLVLFNWGGTPDTSPGHYSFDMASAGQYALRLWLPPSERFHRDFCFLSGFHNEVTRTPTRNAPLPVRRAVPGAPGSEDSIDWAQTLTLPAPPAGQQYEVIVEVTDVTKESPYIYHEQGQYAEPLSYHKREAIGDGPAHGATPLRPCHRLDDEEVRAVEFDSPNWEWSDAYCVDEEGRNVFIDTRESNAEEEFTWVHTLPHATGNSDCQVWELSIEYIDEDSP